MLKTDPLLNKNTAGKGLEEGTKIGCCVRQRQKGQAIRCCAGTNKG